MMQKTTYVFPIIGGRKAEQLESNIGALDVALSDEQIKFLEDVLTFDKGFPDSYIVSDIDGLCRLPVHLYVSETPGRRKRSYPSGKERGEFR